MKIDTSEKKIILDGIKIIWDELCQLNEDELCKHGYVCSEIISEHKCDPIRATKRSMQLSGKKILIPFIYLILI